MKRSESVGCFLLLTIKDKLESAERALDTVFEMMAAKVYHKQITHDHE
jgi:hypothetical protein